MIVGPRYNDEDPAVAAAYDAPEEEPMTEHYFAFSTNWNDDHKRLCRECGLTYDAGEHREVNRLKPYTTYFCPNGGVGLGHSSRYTGSYDVPELRSPTDHLCICGQELVQEDRTGGEPMTGHYDDADVKKAARVVGDAFEHQTGGRLVRQADRVAIARAVLDAVAGDLAARALEEAADAWQTGEWANVPRHANRVADRLGAAQHITDWLRARAARLREGG